MDKHDTCDIRYCENGNILNNDVGEIEQNCYTTNPSIIFNSSRQVLEFNTRRTDTSGSIPILHIILHFLTPLPIALSLYKKAWLKNYALLLAGLLIDIDHLLADPIYDAERCSIGFHPLHTPIPIVMYILMLAHPKTRVLGFGLCLHILLDGADCLL